MFDGPEYASYIALCRELRLEREWERGDWHTWAYQPGHVFADLVELTEDGLDAPDPQYLDADGLPGCWLPRLDQWLTMLEEEGIEAVLFSRADGVCQVLAYPLSSIHALEPGPPAAPTREEATARLWMAVTGRTVGATTG